MSSTHRTCQSCGTLTAALVGGFTGAVVGGASLLGYSIWWELATRQFRGGAHSLTAEVFTWLGMPPEADPILLFPAVAIGITAGILIDFWSRRRARWLATKTRKA